MTDSEYWIYSIKSRLKELRKSKKMSVEDMASKLYISAPAIYKWESTKNTGLPALDHVIDISVMFEVSADWLLLGKGRMYK